jgi:hypothetical protein
MPHLLDCNSLEQLRQRLEPLVVEMKMKIHVLVYGLKLVGNALVQETNTVRPVHSLTSNSLYCV